MQTAKQLHDAIEKLGANNLQAWCSICGTIQAAL